jgi:NinB protein
MDKQTFRLVTPQARQNAATAVACAPEGYHVTITPPSRSLDANAKLHAMIADIMRQDPDKKGCNVQAWKLLFMDDAFHETGDPEFGVKMVPNLRSDGYLVVNPKTSQLSIGRCNILIEAMYRYGAQHGIVWSEPNPWENER